MTHGPLVRRIDREGVAIVELNRPDRRNALTGPLLDELAEHITAIGADERIGAVVLCGAEGAFCSGIDLTEYRADPPPEWLPTSRASLQAAHVAIASCDAPVVVALERYAINGGAAFALAGDFVVAGEQAWLQVGEVHMGMPAPMNLAWLVARHPLSVVHRIVLVGDRIAGPELLRLNVAHEVVPDADVRARAEEVAVGIAAAPQGAARAIKRGVAELAATMPVADWFARAAELRPPPERRSDAPQA